MIEQNWLDLMTSWTEGGDFTPEPPTDMVTSNFVLLNDGKQNFCCIWVNLTLLGLLKSMTILGTQSSYDPRG